MGDMEKEMIEMIDMRRMNNDELYQVRKQIVRLRKCGKTFREIRELVGVWENKSCAICKKYDAGGVDALKPKKSGRKEGSGKKLTPEQEAEIRKAIIDKTPLQLKLEFALWTRDAIIEYIKWKYKIEIPRQTMSDYLKRWGFSCQRPGKRSYRQNAEAVEKFKKEEYPAVLKAAKEENAEIFWGDETGVNNKPFSARGFSPKGRTPVMKIETKMEKTNMISAITNQGKVRFMCYEENMTQQLFLKFIRNLIKTTDKKVYLIVDNLKVHHGKKVAKWVKENEDKVRLFYLPSYAPEINPDEYLNNALKQNVHKGVQPKRTTELKARTAKFMRSLQRSANRVMAFFEHPKLEYQLATV